jgi:hypothetical protein
MHHYTTTVLPMQKVLERLLDVLGSISPSLRSQFLSVYPLNQPPSSIWASIAHEISLSFGISASVALDIATTVFAIQIGTGLLDHVQDGEIISDISLGLNDHQITNLGVALITCGLSILPQADGSELPLVTTTVVKMCEGQNLDLHSTIPTLDEYEARLKVKVGVFGALALGLPAIIGAQPPSLFNVLSTTGEYLALLYQVENDWEGVYRSNKFTDLTRRWTWPSVFVTSIAPKEVRDIYLTFWESGDIEAVRQMSVNLGTLQYLAALKSHYAECLIDSVKKIENREAQIQIYRYCEKYFHVSPLL